MRLQTKVLLVVLTLALLVGGSFMALLARWLQQPFEQVEAGIAEEALARTHALIDTRLRSLEALARKQELAALHRLRPLPASERERLQRASPLLDTDTMPASDVNLVMLVSAEGRQVVHVAAVGEQQQPVRLEEVAPWQRLFPQGMAWFSFDPAAPRSGISVSPAGPLELVSIAVTGGRPERTDPDAPPPVLGSLLLGRLVEQQGRSVWEAVLRADVAIADTGEVPTPGGERLTWQTSDGLYTAGRETMADASGRNELALSVYVPRGSVQRGMAGVFAAIVAMVFGGLVLTMAFIGALRWLVLRRLARLARAAGNLQHPGDMRRRIEDDTSDEIGQLVQAFNTMLDRMNAQSEHQRMTNRELVIALQAKDEFLHTVSHELRTPLTTIRGFAEQLQQAAGLAATGSADDHAGPAAAGGTDGEAVDAGPIGQIQHASEHLLGLINELLDLARARAGALEVRRAPVDVPELFDDVRPLVAGEAQRRGLELEIEPPPDDCPAVRGDPRRLCQVLVNLIGNAIKFCDHGAIRVAATPDDRTVTLSVSDEGPGIEPDRLASIFQPFDRNGRAGGTGGRAGSGLGLAIVHEFVTRMGGHIDVDSTVGEGTTVRVALPRAVTD